MCASALCLPVCVFNHPFVFFFSFSYFFFSFAFYCFPCILPPVGYIRFRFILCERREATYIFPFDHFVFIFDVFIAGVRWSRAANAAVEISSLIIAARHLAVARGNGLRYMRAVCLVKRLTAVRY